jgi:hypothetical protein
MHHVVIVGNQILEFFENIGDSTWLPLKFTLKNNIIRSGMRRGDIPLTFRLDLKKNGNMISTTLHFLTDTITQQNPKSNLDA